MPRHTRQRVREAREARGLTIAELATLVGRSRRSIYRLENGEVDPPIEQWLRIAAALDTPLGDLFHQPDVTRRSA